MGDGPVDFGNRPADTTIVYRAHALTTRLLEYWKGSRRLWRSHADGSLASLTVDEFDRAAEKAHHG